MPDLTLATAIAQSRNAADHVMMAARLTRDLPGYLRTPLTLDRARQELTKVPTSADWAVQVKPVQDELKRLEALQTP